MAERNAKGQFKAKVGSPKRKRRRKGLRKDPGAKQTVISYYLRNRIWGNVVKVLLQKSWDWLDKTFLGTDNDPDAKRLRTFYGIGYHGYDVRTPQRIANEIDLVNLVAIRPGFEATENIYNSILWHILSDPKPIFDVVKAETKWLLLTLNLYQAEEGARKRGQVLFPTEPAFSDEPLVYGKTVLPWDDETLTFDHVALLICNYWLQLDRLDLYSANFYLQTLLHAVDTLITKFNIPAVLARDLKLLIKKKIAESPPKQHYELDFSSRRPPKRDRLMGPDCPDDPIRSDAYRWLLTDEHFTGRIAAYSPAIVEFFTLAPSQQEAQQWEQLRRRFHAQSRRSQMAKNNARDNS